MKTAGKKGRGVFAARDITKGEVIELAPYLLLSEIDHAKVRKTDLIRFVYDAGRGRAALGLGFASLYNHADEANADYILDKKKRQIKFTALAAIERGSEVTIDYGFHPAVPATWEKDYGSFMRKSLRKP